MSLFADMIWQISQMPLTVWEIYLLGENGEKVEHTPENHRELTFTNQTDLLIKADELFHQGIRFEVWQIGSITFGPFDEIGPM